MRVWTSKDLTWRVEERAGRFEARMLGAVIAAGTRTHVEQRIRELGGPSLDDMFQG